MGREGKEIREVKILLEVFRSFDVVVIVSFFLHELT